MATKNLGQVAGIHIGTTPPSNTILIWYDSTPSQKKHKVYDPTLKQWVVLDQNIISVITYSELTNMAKNSGLSVGSYFRITDKSSALALAITSTKVQYCDALGNILIDDLGTNIQYHVTSSNLQIDDVVGVFDVTNRKLVFQFKEQTPDFTADDYVLGKIQRNNIWSLAKYKLSTFLSKVTGNSITWNGGFFFSFSDALKNVLDKAGGVVSKTTYDSDKDQLVASINNVGKENQNIIQNAHNELIEATTADVIYSKKLPSLSTDGAPVDVLMGDTLLNIISKIQRYINKFKYSSGIRIDANFADATSGQYVNNNDTVKSAFQKIQYWVKKLKTGNNINVSSKEYQSLNSLPENITEDDDLTTAIAKLEYWAKNSAFDSATIAYGVLPTDICKVIAFWPLSAITPTTFTGLGIGCVVVQGQNNQLFSRDDAHLYDFYSFYPYFPQSSTHPKILGFAPVIPVMINDSMQFSSACPFVHYAGEGGVTMQLIICIPKTMLEGWQADGYLYLECDPSATVYGKQANIPSKTLLMSYTNFFNFWITENELKAGTGRNIDFFVTLTRKKTL